MEGYCCARHTLGEIASSRHILVLFSQARLNLAISYIATMHTLVLISLFVIFFSFSVRKRSPTPSTSPFVCCLSRARRLPNFIVYVARWDTDYAGKQICRKFYRIQDKLNVSKCTGRSATEKSYSLSMDSFQD